MRALSGRNEEAIRPLERALTLAERLLLPEVFVEALTSRGITVLSQGRLIEARILLEAAAERAHTHQLYASALRVDNNLAAVLEGTDSYADALVLAERAIAIARRRGDRRWESILRTGSIIQRVLLGRWDDALLIAAEEEPTAAGEIVWVQLLAVALVHCERGEPGDGARAGYDC